MKFRLTYEGCDLRPSQQNKPFHKPDKLAIPKHKLRRHFHHQLKHLWNTNKFLKNHMMPATDEIQRPIAAEATTADPAWGHDPNELIPMVDVIAAKYHEFGYRFVPLVRERASLLCS